MHHSRPAYKPAAGSIAARVLELLQFLPRGTWLDAQALRDRLQLTHSGSLHIHLQRVVSHGLLRVEKRQAGNKLMTHWSAA